MSDSLDLFFLFIPGSGNPGLLEHITGVFESCERIPRSLAGLASTKIINKKGSEIPCRLRRGTSIVLLFIGER